MDGFSSHFSKQYSGLLEVPGAVAMNWPTFFSFAVVRVVAGTAINLIPNVGGYLGMVVNAGVTGFGDVVKFATWDKCHV